MCKKYQAVALYKADENRKKEFEKRKKNEDRLRASRLEELRVGERPPSLFGIPYETATAWSSTIILGIPDFITYCCACIDCTDYSEEGVFRLSPMKSELDKLVDIFDHNKEFPPFSEILDINVVAGVIKKFIRELPESPFSNLNFSAMTPRELIEALPSDTRRFIQLIFYIFHKVSLNKSKTKMGYTNLVIVTPTLPPVADGKDRVNFVEKYYKVFVEDYDSVFVPEELPLPENWPHIF